MKNIVKHALLALFIFFTLFSACKKDPVVLEEQEETENIPAIPADPALDIYTAGYYTNNNTEIACYWKNGVLFPVIDQTKASRARDLIIEAGITYLAGKFNNKPCYWKDGVRNDLSTELYNGEVRKMLISGETIFLLGVGKLSAESYEVFILWKKSGQQEPEMLTTNIPSINRPMMDMAINNGELYIAGGSLNNKPGYWINNWDTWVEIDEGIGYPNGIAFYNNQMILSGYKYINNVAEWGYWENGLFNKVNFRTSAGNLTDIVFDQDGKFYQIGYMYNSESKLNGAYWINGIFQESLPSPYMSYAHEIAFKDDDKYIAGYQHYDYGNKAGYWKNNVWQNYNLENSSAMAIYLVIK